MGPLLWLDDGTNRGLVLTKVTSVVSRTRTRFFGTGSRYRLRVAIRVEEPLVLPRTRVQSSEEKLK